MDKKRAHYWMCSQEEAWRTLQPSYIDVSWEKPGLQPFLVMSVCMGHWNKCYACGRVQHRGGVRSTHAHIIVLLILLRGRGAPPPFPRTPFPPCINSSQRHQLTQQVSS